MDLHPIISKEVKRQEEFNQRIDAFLTSRKGTITRKVLIELVEYHKNTKRTISTPELAERLQIRTNQVWNVLDTARLYRLVVRNQLHPVYWKPTDELILKIYKL